MRIRNFFLDQGETLGGAERFLFDFFGQLSETEIQRLSAGIVGAKLQSYRDQIPVGVAIIDFKYPSLKGNIFKKAVAGLKLLRSAYALKTISQKHGNGAHVQFFANTPRTIFVAWLAKVFFGLKGRLIIMIHDFTIPTTLLRKVSKKADVIIANTVNTRQIIREHMHEADTQKIKIVENGIDFTKVEAVETNQNQKIEKIVLLGRIDPRKGQKYLVEAADLLQERNPHLTFFIVGTHFSGDKATVQYHKSIQDFVKDRELKNVYFLDEVQNPLEAFTSANLILALPTEPETFGRIVIEGLALGKPVIAFDQMGPQQILQSFAQWAKVPADLFLVEPNNAMSLAEKIAHLADNPDELAGIGTKARNFVFQKYNLAETKKHLWKILTEC